MIYTLFMVLGFVCALLYIIFFAKKFGIKTFKGVVLIVFAYGSLYAVMMLLYYFIDGKFGGKNMIRVFILIPFAVIFFAHAFGINKKKALDYIAPVPLIVFGVAHFGCASAGCCYSNIAMQHGIYNRYVGQNLFPNQYLEAITACLLVVGLILWLHKNKYDMGGKAMGYMLIIYGFLRFFLEFIRGNDKLFLGISELALWALATGIFGILYIVFLNKRERKKNVLQGQKENNNEV